MRNEVVVEPEALDVMINTNIRQVIVHEEDMKTRPETLRITDGSRLLVCDKISIMDCYFEEMKVTIKEGDEYTQYLWTDREVVNIAMLQGLQSGGMLKERMTRYGKYLVIRW